VVRSKTDDVRRHRTCYSCRRFWEAERDELTEITFDPILEEAGQRGEALKQGQERLFRARLETIKSATEQLTQQGAQIASQLNGIDAQQEALGTPSRSNGLISAHLFPASSMVYRSLPNNQSFVRLIL